MYIPTYGLNDRAKDEDSNKNLLLKSVPVGLQFPSISRSAAKTARPRTK